MARIITVPPKYAHKFIMQYQAKVGAISQNIISFKDDGVVVNLDALNSEAYGPLAEALLGCVKERTYITSSYAVYIIDDHVHTLKTHTAFQVVLSLLIERKSELPALMGIDAEFDKLIDVFLAKKEA